LRCLRDTPLDALVLEAGLDYRVGRLDEPTSAFDPQLKNDVIAALKRQSASRSIVVITHDMELARACDRVLFIKERSLVGQDSWDTLAAHNDVFRSWHAAEAGAAQ